jgi:hypothetical protein
MIEGIGNRRCKERGTRDLGGLEGRGREKETTRGMTRDRTNGMGEQGGLSTDKAKGGRRGKAKKVRQVSVRPPPNPPRWRKGKRCLILL